MAHVDGRKLRLKLAVVGVLAGIPFAAADPAAYTIQQIGLPVGNNGVGPNFIDAAGQVAGLTANISFNNGVPSFQYTSWYYSPTTGTTTTIGLTDALHTGPDGMPVSVDVCMNAAGIVAGTSESFGTKGAGYDAWVYSPSSNTTQMIGLLDAGHVYDGLRVEWVQGINSAGEVLGRATSYDGANGGTGTDVWIYSPSTNTAQIIGLTDSLHTDSADFNYRLDFPGAINDAGSAIGAACSYLPDGGQGLDAWYYSPSNNTSKLIGLTDPAHTDSNGTSYEWALLLSENGSAAGTAVRYSGSTNERQDAWVYSPVTNSTTVIGLTDAAHTLTGGFVYNKPIAINNSGQIAGTPNRSNGTTADGQDAWVYSPLTQSTQLIGLTDSAHMQSSGYAMTVLTAQNNSGVIAGYTERYSGNTDEGFDAWIFDPSSDRTFDLFESQSSTGQAQSYVTYLGDDGTALGYYNNYSDGTTAVSDAFRWTETGGFRDLGAMIVGGLSANGWENLAGGTVENSSGIIAGYGNTLVSVRRTTPLLSAASTGLAASGRVGLAALSIDWSAAE